MRNKMLIIVSALTIAASGMMAQAQDASSNDAGKAKAAQAAGNTVEPSALYEKAVAGVEKQFVPLAEAMPADKFDFAPTQGEFKGVNNFGAMAKHVAQANMMFYGAVLGEKASPEEMKASEAATGRDQILAMLKKSFEMGHRAAASINASNAFQTVDSPFGGPAVSRAGLMTTAIAHAMDHYGQMVEYARMNGIIPPASRKK